MTRKMFAGSYRSGALLATAATAVALGACSSSKNGDATDTAFVAKANGICAKAVAEHDGHRVPVPNFDPLHPRASDLPSVGRYFAKYGAASTTAAQLDALAPPTKHSAEWAKLRGLVDQAAANAQRQIDAAERSDVTGFEKTVRTARSLADRIDQVGPAVGFGSSSPCRQVFG